MPQTGPGHLLSSSKHRGGEKKLGERKPCGDNTQWEHFTSSQEGLAPITPTSTLSAEKEDSTEKKQSYSKTSPHEHNILLLPYMSN